jgi:hypothetical protein
MKVAARERELRKVGTNAADFEWKSGEIVKNVKKKRLRIDDVTRLKYP